MNIQVDSKIVASDCSIVCSGGGSWAFESLARELSDSLWIDVSDSPRKWNYLLCSDASQSWDDASFFISYASMQLAADKRLQAERFKKAGVPVPETHLFDSLAEAERFVKASSNRQWCLKFPIGCGASGHRMFAEGMMLPKTWPFPLVLQEFIPLQDPQVFRLYGAGGELFGWNVRRYPKGAERSPWVAHARGARYEFPAGPPIEAESVARAALEAAGLFGSFGCADLLCTPKGDWLVLEVGTDGMFNHVDRALDSPERERHTSEQIAKAFWAKAGDPPWGKGPWRRRSEQ